MNEEKDVKQDETLQDELDDFIGEVKEPTEEPEEVKEEIEVAEETTEDEPAESSETEEVEETKSEEDSIETKDNGEIREEATEQPKEVELSETDSLRQQNEALSKQLEQMSGSVMGMPQPPQQQAQPQTEVPKEAPPQPQAPVQQKPDIREFVNQDQFDEMQTDVGKFNQVLTNVYNTATETAYRNVPQMVNNLIKQQTFLKDKVDDFYKKNEDLLPYRQFVGFVANELSSQSPELDVESLFNKVGQEVRGRLGINNKPNGKS